MPTDGDTLRTFHAGSAMHAAVIVVVALLAAALALLRRRLRESPRGGTLDRALALAAAVSFVAINVRQLAFDDFDPNTALPLHISDVTMLAVPLALWTSRPLPRAVVYFWGLGLGSLAFITPDLKDGPARAGFWTFWVGHALMMIAIAYDLFGRGYRPGWRDWRLAAAVGLAYAAMITPYNAITRHSYGYLGPDQPGQPALLALFGPWPVRVVPLVLAGLAVMALLTLPWVRRRTIDD